MVVLVAPVFDDDPGLGQRPELFPVQALFPESGVEAFDVTVLPGAPGINVEGLDSLAGQPLPKMVLNKLGSIIAADVLRSSMLVDQAGHDLPDLPGVDLTVDMDAPALPRVLVQNGQHPQLPSAHGDIVNEVPSPHVIAVGGCGRKARGDALTTLSGLLRRDHQAEFPAQVLDLAGSDIPAFRFQQSSDFWISHLRMLS